MKEAQRKVKNLFDERIDAISQPKFIDQYVINSLVANNNNALHPTNVKVSKVQNDGTGPATIKYRVGEATGIFAKLYADESGAHAYNVLQDLWQDGFNKDKGYQVPEPLYFLPEYNLVLMREAPGECLDSQVSGNNGKAVNGLKEAARWLHKLHKSSIRVGRVDRPWYIFQKLADRLSKAAATHPDELKKLTEMLGQLAGLYKFNKESPLVQSHGQFRPIHVFLESDTVTVIDLDRSAPAEPAKDLAEFIHRLRSTVFRNSQSREKADLLTRAFLDEYAKNEPRYLHNLPFYLGFLVLVSLCRHMKRLKHDAPEWEPMMHSYRHEFETIVSGTFYTNRSTAEIQKESPPNKETENLNTTKLEIRINEIVQPEFIQEVIYPVISRTSASRVSPSNCKTEIIQNTGTGRVTVSYLFEDRCLFFGKLYSDKLGLKSYQIMKNLWDGGFGRDDQYQVSEPIAYDPKYNFLLTKAAEGTPLLSYIGQDGSDLDNYVRQSARWLVQLHQSPIRIGENSSLWDSLKLFRIINRFTKAAARAPHFREKLIGMVARLCQKGKQHLDPVADVQTHGRFHCEHIFVGNGNITVIDPDTSVPADPAKDLAEFLSMLRHKTFKVTGSTKKADGATKIFLEEYLSHLPGNAKNLSIYWAAYLLLTFFHYVKKNKPNDTTDERTVQYYEKEFNDVISEKMIPE